MKSAFFKCFNLSAIALILSYYSLSASRAFAQSAAPPYPLVDGAGQVVQPARALRIITELAHKKGCQRIAEDRSRIVREEFTREHSVAPNEYDEILRSLNRLRRDVASGSEGLISNYRLALAQYNRTRSGTHEQILTEAKQRLFRFYITQLTTGNRVMRNCNAPDLRVLGGRDPSELQNEGDPRYVIYFSTYFGIRQIGCNSELVGQPYADFPGEGFNFILSNLEWEPEGEFQITACLARDATTDGPHCFHLGLLDGSILNSNYEVALPASSTVIERLNAELAQLAPQFASCSRYWSDPMGLSDDSIILDNERLDVSQYRIEGPAPIGNPRAASQASQLLSQQYLRWSEGILQRPPSDVSLNGCTRPGVTDEMTLDGRRRIARFRTLADRLSHAIQEQMVTTLLPSLQRNAVSAYARNAVIAENFSTFRNSLNSTGTNNLIAECQNPQDAEGNENLTAYCHGLNLVQAYAGWQALPLLPDCPTGSRAQCSVSLMRANYRDESNQVCRCEQIPSEVIPRVQRRGRRPEVLRMPEPLRLFGEIEISARDALPLLQRFTDFDVSRNEACTRVQFVVPIFQDMIPPRTTTNNFCYINFCSGPQAGGSRPVPLNLAAANPSFACMQPNPRFPEVDPLRPYLSFDMLPEQIAASLATRILTQRCQSATAPTAVHAPAPRGRSAH